LEAYLYLGGTILCTIYAQLIIKWRVAQGGMIPEALIDKFWFVFSYLFDFYVLSGFVAAFFAAMFWIAAMTKFDVSYAYPIVTGSLVLLTVLLSVIILGESMRWMQVVGLLFIIIGVVLGSWQTGYG